VASEQNVLGSTTTVGLFLLIMTIITNKINNETYAPLENVVKVETIDKNISVVLNFPAIMENAVIAKEISAQTLFVKPKGLNRCLK
jgi:hypothetical protein